MKRTYYQSKQGKRQTKKAEGPKERKEVTVRDVIKRLFSHKLDKPSSTNDRELWMKIK